MIRENTMWWSYSSARVPRSGRPGVSMRIVMPSSFGGSGSSTTGASAFLGAAWRMPIAAASSMPSTPNR